MERIDSRISMRKIVMKVLVSLAFAYGIVLFLQTIYESKENGEKVEKEASIARHEAVLKTTVDASGGSGLVRLRQAMVRTADGACTVTVQRYERRTTDDLFIWQPRIETFPCSGT